MSGKFGIVRSGFTLTLPPLSVSAFVRLARSFPNGDAVTPPAQITVFAAMRSVRLLTSMSSPSLSMFLTIAPHLIRTPSFASERSALRARSRSEEHTSELQSLAYLVCRLLLEKKKELAQRN